MTKRMVVVNETRDEAVARALLSVKTANPTLTTIR